LASLGAVTVALLSARPCGAHPQPRDERLFAARPATVRDAQRRVVGYAQRSAQGFWITQEVAQRSIAWVCSDAQTCAPVLRLMPCVESQQLDTSAVMYGAQACPSGGVRIEPGPWQSWAPVVVVTQPVIPPIEYDRCAGLSPSEWTHAGGAAANFAVGYFDGGVWLGGTVVNSYRRHAIAYTDSAIEAHSGCDDRSPRGFVGGRLLGSEFGFDVRGQVLSRLGAPATDMHSLIGVAPIAKSYFARGRLRLPSLLGLFLPEVGWAFRSRSYDENGVRSSRSRSSNALYVRAAGWTASWVFARYPTLSLDVTVAPWIELPLNGQPLLWGASASVGLSFVAW